MSETSLRHQEAIELHLYLDQLNVNRESEYIGNIELSLIGRVNTYTEQIRKDKAALQSKIDSLMLEYCPDEMTEEQIENWEKHQVLFKQTL